MNSLVWCVKVSGTPVVMRKCGKCGNERFLSSGRFRVNANGSRIDVWLIFKCEHCNATWNMEVLSRVRPGDIDTERYRSFLCNDKAAAMRCALDGDLLRRNNVVLDAAAFLLDIQGEMPAVDVDAQIVIKPDAPLGISASRVIAQKLGLSQNAVRRLAEEGYLTCGMDIRKKKLGESVAFDLHVGWERR